jgi:dihydroxyacetone kinase-like predicted kinase
VVVRLSLERTALTSLRGRLAELGDEATVVAEADGSWLAHLHTHQPDAAIEAAKRAGSVDDIRVTELPW